MFTETLRNAWRLLRIRRVRAAPFRCPACGPSLLLRLSDDEMGVRCLRCRGSAVSLSLVKALNSRIPDLGGKQVYELSARGPLHRYLARRAGTLSCSEFFEGAVPGSVVGGVRCEDVQQLTFADALFDLCTCTEVFEHVPEDRRGFAEILRVLKPGGLFVFSVPLHDRDATRERARLRDGKVEHLMAPEYHGDHLSGAARVLSFRDYGRDIVDRLRAAGFSRAAILPPQPGAWWGYQRPIVMAEKA